MRWIHRLTAELEEPTETLGAKAQGLVLLHRLGLPVPAGFVVSTEACRAFLRDRRLPEGLGEQLAAAVADLEERTGRHFGGASAPLVLAVRSGAGVSMPGMMDTVLNLGLTRRATAALAAETGDLRFAQESRGRFLSSFATATAALEELLGDASGPAVTDDADRQLELAVQAVFASWDTPRALTYRELHDIPHHLGTAAIVQTMVFGNRDGHSGAGVAFSRHPNTGACDPFGEVLFGHQGDDVVSGRSATRPVTDLADREPAVWAALSDALRRVEEHYRDACYLEFTFQAGELWLLQARPGRFAGAAAVRLVTDLVDEGVIGRDEALLRVSPQQLRLARTPRIAASAQAQIIARGVGACPGVAAGAVATTTEAAVRLAAEGPVILVRPETSPHDLRGLAAATGIVTARGGPASHAAVVARSMDKPAVVGVTDLTIDVTDALVRVGGYTLREGAIVTIDGSSGEVALGRPRVVTGAAEPHLRRMLRWAEERDR